MSVAEELITYFRVLWRYKWLIMACAMLSAIVAFCISLILTPRYEASATVRVASAPGGTDDYIYILTLSRLSNTYIEIASSDISLEQVSKKLGIQELPRVEIEPVPDTELILITGINADPVLAQDIANTIANNMVEQSMQLYGGDAPTMREILEDQLHQAKIELDTAVIAYDSAIQNSQSSSTPEAGVTTIPDTYLEMLSRLVGLRHQIYNQLLVECEQARINEQFHANAITIVESATIPDEPATPNLPVNAALGLVAGLSMGCVTAFLLTGLDNTLQSIEDVQSITTLPILCKIPELTRKSAVYRHINLNRCERSFPMAALEQVCAQLTMPDSVPKFKSFGVTSPEPGSGKSTFAANLALSLAQKGKKVVLIELHSNRRLDRSYLGFTNGPGISNFMVGEIDWERALHATAYPNLWIITSGSSLTNDLLTPKAIREIMIHLKTRCHVVLLDMADLRSIADPTALFSYTDTIIMVVARNKTQKQSLQDALERVEEYNAKIWGVVFNRNTTSQAYGYYAPGKLSKHLSAVERSQISTPN